ncbi:MAG: rod shape-determining protein MreC [Longimicrobiales bacterium]
MAIYADSPEEARGRREFSVALVFVLLSLVVLYLPEGVQSQVAAAYRTTILRPFLFMQEVLVQARLHAEEAGGLQAELDSLSALIVIQAPLVEENRHLRELLELRDRDPATFLPASVIRPGTPGSESMFLLDVGSEDGVRMGDPVIMRDGGIGLVGVIQQVRRGSAIGLDWSHPDFSASAVAEDSGVFGFVRPVRGLFREQDRLLLDGTPFYESLPPGTLITTSGLGGVYPRGIPIGHVESVAGEEGGWLKSYWLRPLVETGSVRHALVVLGDGIPEDILQSFGGQAGPVGDSGRAQGDDPFRVSGGRGP